MKPNTSPRLEIILPRRIIVDADCDLNSLLRFFSRAESVEECVSATNAKPGVSCYSGPSTFYYNPSAIPAINPFIGDVFSDVASAQVAKNEIVARIAAEQEAKTAPVDIVTP